MKRLFVLIILFIMCKSTVCESFADVKDNLNFSYHNYESLTRSLKSFAKRYSNLTSLYSIGRSIQRRELWVMKLTAANSKENTIIANVKLLGNIHGNEAAGREILMHLIEYLVKGYETGDRKVVHLLQNNIIHILPSLNPDGFERAIEGLCEKGPGRYNAKDMDLNRNFPDYFQENKNPRQPESIAISKWMNSTNFILSASLHGGAMVANYPFENKKPDPYSGRKLAGPSPSPDDDVFEHLALVYSKAHPVMHLGQPCPNTYGRSSFRNGITNGAAWYMIEGGMQDYNYAMHGCMEVTLEVSCCKYPKAENLENIWLENRDALIEYCLMAGMGVKGVIKDSNTKKPIEKARLIVEERDMPFYTSSGGEFFRILLPGSYVLQVNANNYSEANIHFTVENPIPNEFPKMKELTIFLIDLESEIKLQPRFGDYEDINANSIDATTLNSLSPQWFSQNTEESRTYLSKLHQEQNDAPHKNTLINLTLTVFTIICSWIMK